MSIINIGILSGSITKTGAVTIGDASHEYKFDLSAMGSLSVSLSVQNANAKLELYDDLAVLLASATATVGVPAAPPPVTLRAGGLYTAKVVRLSADTNYTLTVAADYAKNDMASARKIFVDAVAKTFGDCVSSADPTDYYQFTLESRSLFSLALSGLSSDVDVELLNESGNVIRKSAKGGVMSEAIDWTLDAGTYYIRVFLYSAASPSTNYNLTVSAVPAPVWTRQIGGTPRAMDACVGVAVDGSSNIYIAGYTYGSLGGANAGGMDAWVVKYDKNGTELWKKQLGTAGDDDCRAITADVSGNVYLTGSVTTGSEEDIWLAKYDSNGVLLWKTQLGAPGTDHSLDVAVDGAGNVYIAGRTDGSLGGAQAGSGDALLVKYNSSGTLLWQRQIGTSAWDYCVGIAISVAGEVIVAGDTNGALAAGSNENSDAFLAKYSSSGTLLWKKQIGTSSEDVYAYAVATDSAGDIYIAGSTFGALTGTNAGDRDVWVAKYAKDGSGVLWIRQFGTAGEDHAYDIKVDDVGDIYIVGYTAGSMLGASAGGVDAWIAKYNNSGTLLWKQQIGTADHEDARGVAIDKVGKVYIAGDSHGSPGGVNAGQSDVWVRAR